MSGLEKFAGLARSVGGQSAEDEFAKKDRAVETRLSRVFAEAAAVRASDVMFECRRGSGETQVYAIVNDRKLRVGGRFGEEEGRQVMGKIFHLKEEGSAQTSYQDREFQGFSVRAGKMALPATISGMRCQRGPHEPDGDHLSTIT